jgi:hypothetical protein
MRKGIGGISLMTQTNSKLFATLRLKELIAGRSVVTHAEYIALMAKAQAEALNVDHAEVVCPLCDGPCDEDTKYCPECKEFRGEWKLIYRKENENNGKDV